MAIRSPSAIICASFNQDNSCLSIGFKDGFKIFSSETGRLCYERSVGAVNIVEMLFSSSLLAVVGAGQQPSLSPRRLCLFNTATGSAARELNFLTSIVSVRFNRQRLVVVLQGKTYIYDLNSLAILDTIDTVPNVKGLCAFSPSVNGCYLALPASTVKGSVLVYNMMDLHSHCQIDAHRSPLAAVALSSTGTYLATASEQGTIIRVHLVSQATKQSCSFRRGTYPSTIYSLSFGPAAQVPDIVIATSSSGTIHLFLLGSLQDKSKKSGSLLGSILPSSINDALEHSHHHVLHNAVSAGVRSCAVVHSVTRVSSANQNATLRASVFVVNYDGYFREFCLKISHVNESTWSLEREFNLLTVADNNGD